MKLHPYRFLYIGCLILLTSCDFLGIGGHHTGNNNHTPSLIWKKETTGSVAPVIDNNSVYVLGAGVASLELNTGSEQWKMPLENPAGLADFATENLLLSDDAVIVGRAKTIQAFAKADGRSLWKTPVNLAPVQFDTLQTTRIPMAQTSSRLFVGGQGRIVGLNKNSGARELTIALDTLAPQGAKVQVTSLLTAGGATSLLFATIQYEAGGPFQVKGNLVAINAKDGTIVWSTPVSGLLKNTAATVAGGLAFSDNHIVILAPSRAAALDPATGNIVWQTSLDDTSVLFTTQLFATDKSVFVNTLSGNVFGLNSADGAIMWHTLLTKGGSFGLSTGLMVLDNGRLYVPLFSDNTPSIKVIETGQGAIENTIKASDIKNIGPDFLVVGGFGFAVQSPYLVKLGAVNTYGIKL